MFRLFCVAALFGFFFGSSKQGQKVRSQVDGFLTELTSDHTRDKIVEKKNEFSEMANRTMANFRHKNGDSSHGKEEGDENSNCKEENSSFAGEETKKPGGFLGSGKDEVREENYGPEAQDAELDTAKVLDTQKAQELADKLGAKPVVPEDENLSAYHHSDDELKSA